MDKEIKEMAKLLLDLKIELHSLKLEGRRDNRLNLQFETLLSQFEKAAKSFIEKTNKEIAVLEEKHDDLNYRMEQYEEKIRGLIKTSGIKVDVRYEFDGIKTGVLSLQVDGKNTSQILVDNETLSDSDKNMLPYIKFFRDYYMSMKTKSESLLQKSLAVREFAYLQDEKNNLTNKKGLFKKIKMSNIDRKMKKLYNKSDSVEKYAEYNNFVVENNFAIEKLNDLIAKTNDVTLIIDECYENSKRVWNDIEKKNRDKYNINCFIDECKDPKTQVNRLKNFCEEMK